jgi:hypothetical protein
VTLLRAGAAHATRTAQVECAACRVWQASRPTPNPPPRPGVSDVLARLRAAIDDVFTRAA